MAPTISPPGAPGEGLSDAQVGLPWLWKLRWGAAAGQLGLVLAGEWVLGGLRHFGILLALVACTALSNLAFTRARFRAGGRLLPAVLVLDVGLLTAMLAVSGGASNPFSVFFLVHVALASVLLRPAYAWAMVVLTVAAFGALFALPGGNHAMHVHGSSFSGHLWGMWVAFALAATFVAYFIGRVTTALKERDRRGRVRGASTLSQQLAKNLFLWPEPSWWRKGLEVWFTLWMEQRWSKQRILETYLNVAQFGPCVFGAEAASRRYFGRSADSLEPEQAALLATVLPSPKKLRAHNPGPFARQRTAEITQLMQELGRARHLRGL